jgi:signal-transduction protein with cAMP-binding, CBS, and nucleotidyltransferase domain
MTAPLSPTRSQIAVFEKKAGDYMRPHGAILSARATLAEAVRILDSERGSSVLIADESGRLLGILTEHDIARRVAFKLAPQTLLGEAMTSPVKSARQDEFLYRAIGRMRQEGMRHLPVVDGENRPVGMLDLHHAIAAAAARMIHQIDRLSRDSSDEGLQAIKQAQVELAQDLVDDNLPAPEIQALVTTINRDLHVRAIENAMTALRAEGWGAPPVAFTVLLMGSGGRGENFLHPDQDNGFILADYDDADHQRIDAWFVALAERFTRGLDRIGFPLCKGGVMATNPLWRKTASQWREQISLWGEKRSPVAVLFADIFLDFMPIYGAEAPAAALRGHVMAVLKRYPALIGALAQHEMGHHVAVGFFGGLRVDSDSRHPGRIDLKLRGTLPLVGALRLYALREQILATSTLARLAAVSATGVISVDDANELRDAFVTITGILLRQQLHDRAAGLEVGNFVDPEILTRLERERLVDGLKAIDRLRKRARADFTGAFW